jgi:hypothetical protein
MKLFKIVLFAIPAIAIVVGGIVRLANSTGVDATGALQAKGAHSSPQFNQIAAPSIERMAPPRAEAPMAKETLASKVDRLAISGNPEDLYAAYQIIFECVYARKNENEGKPSNASGVCSDITPGQIASRLQMLDVAAAAGVHGAFISQLNEGPTGSGLVLGTPEQMKDPTVSAFYAKVESSIEAAAKTGDIQATAAMATTALAQNDKAGALVYWIAQDQMAKARGNSIPNADNIISSLSHDLTPDQVAFATAKGTQIATAARASPYWNQK